MSIINKFLSIKMPDGSAWAVPVDVIATNRAQYYADEFDGDVKKSLKEDTLPLFESDNYEIKDWAACNMNWDDISQIAVQTELREEDVDYQEGWVNGDKELVDTISKECRKAVIATIEFSAQPPKENSNTIVIKANIDIDPQMASVIGQEALSERVSQAVLPLKDVLSKVFIEVVNN